MTLDILYIAGFGRSGSTLVESVARESFDVLSLGELFFIWERGVIANERVGNGERFRENKFWSNVINAAFGSVSEERARKFNSVFQAFRGEAITGRSLKEQLEFSKKIDEFADIAIPLYDAIIDAAAGRIVVDSSKYPLFGAALATVLKRDIGVIHSYRDPRAVAFSWSLHKARPEAVDGKFYMSRSKTVLSSIWRWKVLNRQAINLVEEFGLQRVRVGYEQFCNRPSDYISLISGRFSIGRRMLPVLEWNSVSGNPARFDGGFDTISIDERWKHDMHTLSRRLVELGCGRQFRDLCAIDKAQFV